MRPPAIPESWYFTVRRTGRTIRAMSAYARERALDQIADLAGHGHDVVTFWREVTEVMTPLVPHYMAPCWYTVDPASLLVTSHFNPAMPELPPEWLELEYYGEDVHDLASVARSASGVSTLHEATGGDPSRSPRWQANMEMGGDQELLVALRTRAGDPWASLGLYREPGEPLFSDDEIELIRAAAPFLGEGAQRALLLGEARDPDGPDAPGLLVLSANGEVESSTPGVERWVSDLPGGDWDAGRLPTAALSVARACAAHGGEPGRARRGGPDRPGSRSASTRTRSRRCRGCCRRR